jgi:predicted glycosyltransferase
LADLDVQVVLSRRHPAQASYVDGIDWRHPPIVLEQSVPFVPLLKSVDAVVCSGGTMLREAAYLGVPSYSIFQSRLGGVDQWLADIGRVVLVRDVAELGKIAADQARASRPDAQQSAAHRRAGRAHSAVVRPV